MRSIKDIVTSPENDLQTQAKNCIIPVLTQHVLPCEYGMFKATPKNKLNSKLLEEYEAVPIDLSFMDVTRDITSSKGDKYRLPKFAMLDAFNSNPVCFYDAIYENGYISKGRVTFNVQFYAKTLANASVTFTKEVSLKADEESQQVSIKDKIIDRLYEKQDIIRTVVTVVCLIIFCVCLIGGGVSETHTTTYLVSGLLSVLFAAAACIWLPITRKSDSELRDIKFEEIPIKLPGYIPEAVRNKAKLLCKDGFGVAIVFEAVPGTYAVDKATPVTDKDPLLIAIDSQRQTYLICGFDVAPAESQVTSEFTV